MILASSFRPARLSRLTRGHLLPEAGCLLGFLVSVAYDVPIILGRTISRQSKSRDSYKPQKNAFRSKIHASRA